MLPTKRRVKKEFFPEIMKKGSFLSGGSFYLRFLNRKDGFLSIFSFVVPNKVKKTSVGRHLIKRRMSFVVESEIDNFKTGFSCLIFAQKDPSALSATAIRKEILDLLFKSGALNKKPI